MGPQLRALSHDFVARSLQENGAGSESPHQRSNSTQNAQYAIIITISVCFVLLCFVYVYCQRKGMNSRLRGEGEALPSGDVAPQRRSGLADSFVEEGEKEWDCVICLNANHPKKTECLLCGTAREVTDAVVSNKDHPLRKTSSLYIANNKANDKEVSPEARQLQMARIRSFHYRRVNNLSLNQRQRGASKRRVWRRVRNEDGTYAWIRNDEKERKTVEFIAGKNGSSLTKKGSPRHEVADGAGCCWPTPDVEVQSPVLESGHYRRVESYKSLPPMKEVEEEEERQSQALEEGISYDPNRSIRIPQSRKVAHPTYQRKQSMGFVAQRDANGHLTWMPAGAVKLDPTMTNDWEIALADQDLEAVASLPFRAKSKWLLSQLDTLCDQWKDEGYIILTIRRSNILTDSLHLNNIPLERWRQRMRVSFHGEPGLDAGGLMREWFLLLTQALFDESLGLFCKTSGEAVAYWINPFSARAVPNHLQYFRFIGRIIGKALLEGQFLTVYLALPLLKHLLGVPITFSDLEFLDQDLYRNMLYLKENTGVDALCLDFTLQEKYGGDVETIELKPNGAQIEVTDENKQEYMDLVLRYHMLDSIKDQIAELVGGLREVVPELLLAPFDYQELEILLCGMPAIDLEDWKKHTDILYLGESGPSKQEKNVIAWFWEAVGGFNDEERARLLQYVTGTSRLPIEGFKGLVSYDGQVRKFTIKLIKLGTPPTGNFPKAHTCFNRIDLPLYASYEDLSRYLSLVINMEITGFSLQ